jgi:hypothetical protein
VSADEERELLLDGGHVGLDGLDIGRRYLRGYVLIGHSFILLMFHVYGLSGGRNRLPLKRDADGVGKSFTENENIFLGTKNGL